MNNTFLKIIKASTIFFIAGFFFFGVADAVYASACQSNTAAVTWTTAGDWTNCGGTTPQTTDTIEILNGHTVTLGADRQVAGAQINSGGTITGSTFVLTVTGTGTGVNGLTLNGSWTGSGGAIVNGSGATIDGTASIANTGTITLTNNKTIASTASLTFAGTIALSANTTVTNNGSVTLNQATTTMTGADASTSIWTQGTNSTLVLNGTTSLATGTLTATASGNTVNYGLSGVQTGKVTTYENLTVSGTSAKTFATTPTVNGIMSLEGTATIVVTTGVVTYGASATLQYNTSTNRSGSTEEWPTTFSSTGGVIIKNTGFISSSASKTISGGTLNINSGARLNTSGIGVSLTVQKDLINSGTISAAGTGGLVFSGTENQSITIGTCTSRINVTKTGGTATLVDNITASTLTVSGVGGTLDLGTGLTHTFTQSTSTIAISNGTVLGNTSTLKTAVLTISGGGVFTPQSGTVEYTGAASAVTVTSYYGLTLSGSGTATGAVTTVTGPLTLSGSVSWSAGAITSTPTSVTMNSSGTLTLGANLVTSGALTLTQGTFDANNLNVTASSFSSSNTNTRAVTMGSGTWTLTGTGTVWDVATATNLTVTANTSTIKLLEATGTATAKTFAGGGKTYNNIWFAPATSGSSTGSVTISGSNTFADFKDDNTTAHSILFTASTTTTITTLTLDTNASNLITLESTSGGSSWNISDTAGTNTVSYVSIKDSVAAGGATWDADDGTNVSVSGNSGWAFPVPAFTISGTANGNDTATVKVAVNGVLDGSHTGTIGSSAWTISGVTEPSVGDIITVWVDGVTDANESTAVTKWASGNVTGMVLNTGILSIGSNQNASVSATNLGLYDADDDEDIMHTSNSGVLLVQGASNTYTGETLSILASNTLTVTSASSETVTTEKINNAGTITSVGSPTYTLSGTSGTLFTNSGTFTQATSEVIVTSASGTPTLLSAGTTFHKLTINSAATVINAGAAITMSSANAANKLYVQTGVLNDGGNQIVGTANGTLVVSTSAALCIGGTAAGTTATCDSGATPTSATTFPTNYTTGNITLGHGGYYRAITIDHTKVPNTNQTDFPILISGTYAYLKTIENGGLVQNVNGYDIGFYSDSALTTRLSWETERYIPTTGEVIYWVKVPTLLTASDTTIYMGYGNPTITTDQSAPTSTWNSAYKSVWHLPNGTSLTANDSTTNANNGTATTPTAVTGQIAGGALFNSSTDYISFAGTPLTSATAFTVSWWEKVTANTNAYPSRMNIPMSGSTDHFFVLASTSATYGPYSFGRSPSLGGLNIAKAASAPAITTNMGTWRHVVITGTDPRSTTASDYKFYVNGTSYSTSSAGNVSAITVDRLGYDGADNGPDAAFDEFRISNGAERSADWITTEYNNQSSPSTFYAVGSETTAPSSTVYYNANAATTVSAIPTYANLKLQPVLTTGRTYTLGSGLSVNGSFTSNPSGAYALTANVGASGLTVLGATTLSGTSSGTTTLDTTSSNYVVSSGSIAIDSGSTLNGRGSTITLSGSGTVFTKSGTYTAGTSTIKLTDATSTDKTFAGGGGTYNNIWLTGAGTGAFIITGSNTFNQFKVDNPPHTVKFTAGTTQTVTDWRVSGIASNLMTLNSTSNGTKWNLYLTPAGYGYGTYYSDYLSLRDSAVTGNAYFGSMYAGANSTDDTTGGSTNTGWTFATRSQGGGGGVESSATPDAGVGGGGQGGGGGAESSGTPDAGAGGGNQGGGDGDVGLLRWLYLLVFASPVNTVLSVSTYVSHVITFIG